MVIVYRKDAKGECGDEYPAAASWRVNADGVLRVDVKGGTAIAIYPYGGWLRAVKGDGEKSAEQSS